MGLNISQIGDSIVVRLDPLDALFAIKRRLDIPRSHVESVDVVERADIRHTSGTWVRAPGTHVPGFARYGSYGFEPNREFWMVRRQEEVVVVAVRDWAYRRLVLGVRDPASLAAELRAMIG